MVTSHHIIYEGWGFEEVLFEKVERIGIWGDIVGLGMTSLEERNRSDMMMFRKGLSAIPMNVHIFKFNAVLYIKLYIIIIFYVPCELVN